MVVVVEGLSVLNVVWLLVMSETGLMAAVVEETDSDVEGWIVVEEDHR